MKALKDFYLKLVYILSPWGELDFDETEDYEEGAYIDYKLYNPEDEDFEISVRYGHIIEDLEKYEFDIDDYVNMWLEAKARGVSGVPGAVGLVNNANAIDKALKEIKERVKSEKQAETSLRVEWLKQKLKEDYLEELKESVGFVINEAAKEDKRWFINEIVKVYVEDKEEVLNKLLLNGFMGADNTYFDLCFEEAGRIVFNNKK